MRKLFTTLALLAIYCSAIAQNLNGGLEQWRTINAGIPPKSYEAPAGWFGVDSLIASIGIVAGVPTAKKMLFKDADAHSGSFAAKIMTRFQGGQLDTLTGVMVNALPGFDLGNFDPNDPSASLTYAGGTVTSQRMESVSAWIKYLPRDADKGRISVRAILTGQGAGGKDSIVGEADTVFSQPVTAYTQVTLNIDYPDTTAKPDKLLILFYSSNMASGFHPADSSVMYVDDISAKAAPVHIQNVSARPALRLYPNPASDRIFLGADKQHKLNIYNSTGTLLRTININKTGADISSLPSGLYYYSLADETTVIQQGSFTIAK